MRRVARDHDETRARTLQSTRDLSERRPGRWPSPREGRVALGDARFVADQDAQMILITLCARFRDQLGEEIRGRRRPHTADDANRKWLPLGLAHDCSTFWNA